MIFWAIAIAILAIIEMLMLFGSFPTDAIYLVTILIMLCVLGILYRIHIKTIEGRIEKLEKELADLKMKLAKQT